MYISIYIYVCVLLIRTMLPLWQSESAHPTLSMCNRKTSGIPRLFFPEHLQVSQPSQPGLASMSKHVKALAISLFFWSWSSWTRPMEFSLKFLTLAESMKRSTWRRSAKTWESKGGRQGNSWMINSFLPQIWWRHEFEQGHGGTWAGKAAWFVFWLMLACVCYCARGRSGKQQASMESMFMKWADQDTCKNIRPLTTVQPILLEPVHANKPLSHSTGQQGSSSPQPSFRWLSFICCSSKLDCWIVGVE